ncbi:hypothetical protein SBBP2_20179 [Burkholderiales bacterium]|jgi:hydroxypyruvate reductase|nr:hypothetical protein SBBP2_20179 [Burkholderiales bacterium]
MNQHKSLFDTPQSAPRFLLRALFATDVDGQPAVDVDAPRASRTIAALGRAEALARKQGLIVLQLGAQEAAEARELVSVHAAIALQGVRDGRPAAPTVILSGGPVLVDGTRVGPAQYLLTLALALDGHFAIHAYASGGEPDSVRSAGYAVFLAPDTLLRAQKLRINPSERLLAQDASLLFQALDDCVTAQPSGSDGDVLRALLLAQE